MSTAIMTAATRFTTLLQPLSAQAADAPKRLVYQVRGSPIESAQFCLHGGRETTSLHSMNLDANEEFNLRPCLVLVHHGSCTTDLVVEYSRLVIEQREKIDAVYTIGRKRGLHGQSRLRQHSGLVKTGGP